MLTNDTWIFLTLSGCALFGVLAIWFPKGRLSDACVSLFFLLISIATWWFLRQIFPSLEEWGMDDSREAYVFGSLLVLAGFVWMFLPSLVEESWLRYFFRVGSVSFFLFGVSLIMNAALRAPPIINIAHQKTSPRWCEEKVEASCLPMAYKEHRVTILVFSAEWCVPCQWFERYTLPDQILQERFRRGNYGTVRAELNTNRDLAARFEVVGVPTTLFLSNDGTELGRTVGYVSPESVLKVLDLSEKKLKK